MDKETKRAKFVWKNMKERCYDPNCKEYKSYGAVGVTMCDEWLDFKAFKNWYFENYYSIDGEYMAVDKDIFGDGKLYSPKTCCIIPFKINGMFVHKHNGIMRGLQKVGKKYQVKVRNTFTGENEYVGTFTSPEIAHMAYIGAKESIIHAVAEEYKDKIPFKVYEKLSTFKLPVFKL